MNKFLRACQSLLTMKNGLKLYATIAIFLMIVTTYGMEEKLKGKRHIFVLGTTLKQKPYRGILARSQFLFNNSLKTEDNFAQENYSMLPLELCTEIAKQIIPKQINTTEELLTTLQNLTYLSKVDQKSKAAVESKEVKRTLLYALAPNYLILRDLEKRSACRVKETLKVSKFFQNSLHSLKNEVNQFISNKTGLKDAIEMLLKFGLNPNFQIDGKSLLIWAIECNDEDAMDFVINAGADINCTYRGRYSALNVAKRTPALAIKLLKKYNAKPSTLMHSPIVSALNALDEEHYKARKTLIKVLVKKGLNADSFMGAGKYSHPLIFEAILLAQHDKKSDLVEFLLKKGAKVNHGRYWDGHKYQTLYEYSKDLPQVLDLLKSHEQITN